MSSILKALESDISALGSDIVNARNKALKQGITFGGKPISPVALISATPDVGPISLALPAAAAASSALMLWMSDAVAHPVEVVPKPAATTPAYVTSKVTPIEPVSLASQTLSLDQIALAKKPPFKPSQYIPKTAVKVGLGALIGGAGIGAGLNYALYGNPLGPSSSGPSGGITGADTAITGAGGGGGVILDSKLSGNSANTPQGGISGLISLIGDTISNAGNALSGATGLGTEILSFGILAVILGVAGYAAYVLIGRAKK